MAKITRRKFIKDVAVGSAAVAGAMAAPGVVRKAYAQKPNLSVAMWNHWIPGATDVQRAVMEEWGKKNKVDVRLDFIGPSATEMLTVASAEYRAGTGHDLMVLTTFDGAFFMDKLEPLNDVVDYVQGKYGKYDDNATYLSCIDGKWNTLPAPTGSHSYPMVTRIDMWREYAGIDVVDIFPPDVRKRDPKKVDAYTYDVFLEACKKVKAAGHMFAGAISECSDADDWVCPLFMSFGSFPVDKKGNITIESDATLEALEYMKELTEYMPKEIYGWDDASNNRWIISGRGSAIQNPPSAWGVAARTRPDVAAQLWHHDTPRGPKGRYRGCLWMNWGLWSFSKNKKVAKELLMYLSESAQQWKLISAAKGYDMPQLKPMYAHPVWEEIGPPKGGQYNYMFRGDEVPVVGGYPAHPTIGAQIYRKFLIPVMAAKVTTGEMTPKEAMKWCARELKEVIE
ncbi:MAG: carbohydrate ABC transporter substrate-binding protein [Desulfobacterales bacterium]|nr:carbohydrate ABC transporter substrate-binding protein [Desulfobacterales bacterium]